MFLNFLHFLVIFSLNFLARVVWERNSGINFFFLSFSAYLIPVWTEIKLEWCFLNFWIFFWNFLDQVRKEQNSGLKFFSLLLALSHPGLDRNNEGMMFFNFFAIFVWIFLPGLCRNGIQDKIFFSLPRPISSRFV